MISWVRSFLLICLLCIVPMGLADATSAVDEAAASALTTMSDPDRMQRAQDAYQAGASLTTLTFAGVDAAHRIETELWESAQSASHPVGAFHASVKQLWQENLDALDAASQRLEAATRTEPSLGEARSLLVAAHLLVQAELDHELAGRIIVGGADEEYHQVKEQRVTFVRNLAVIEQHLIAFDLVMDRVSVSGPDLDLGHVAQGVASVSSAHEWQRPAGGFMHALVRHASLAQQPDPTATLVNLDANLAIVQAIDPSSPIAAWRALIVGDIGWWVHELGPDVAPEEEALVGNLDAWLRAATYEDKLLVAQTDSALPTWWWLAALGIVATASIWFFWPQVSRRLRMLLFGIIIVMVMQGVGAEPPEGNPIAGPVAVSAPAAPGAWGTVTAGDDVVHFTWVHCQQPARGCYDIWTRDYHVTDRIWSEPSKFLDLDHNMSIPWLLPDLGYMIWQANPEGHLAVFGCDPSDCRPTLISQPGVASGQFRAQADSSGRLWVLWHADTGEGARVMARSMVGGTWGSVQTMPGGGEQRMGSLAAGQTVHATWYASASPEEPVSYGELRHARIDGNHGFEAVVEGVDQPRSSSVAIGSTGGIGIAYGHAGDVRFVQQSDDGWTGAVNVSRSPSSGTETDVLLLPHEGGWAVVYKTGAYGTMSLWAASQQNGLWLQPVRITPPEHATFVLNPTATWSDGLHVSWTGTRSGSSDVEAFYRYIDFKSAAAPQILKTWPGPGAWSKTTKPMLTAEFAAGAALDLERSHVQVNGQTWPLDLQVVKGVQQVVAQAPELTEGGNAIQWTIVDVRGQEAVRSGEVMVDTQPPGFTLEAIRDGKVVAPHGWSRDPTRFYPRVAADTGSPIRVQISWDDGFKYVDLGEAGLEIEDGGFVVPENRYFELRLRAIDAAGNVATVPKFATGWDQEPPIITWDAPSHAQPNATLHVRISTGGSPIEGVISWQHSGGDLVQLRTAGLADATAPAKDGAYTVLVEAVDAAGNQAVPLARSVFIDGVAPHVEIEGSAAVVVDEGGLARLMVDGVGQDMMPGETRYPIGSTGQPGTVRIQAEDLAGNVYEADLSFDGAKPPRVTAVPIAVDGQVASTDAGREAAGAGWMIVMTGLAVASGWRTRRAR